MSNLLQAAARRLVSAEKHTFDAFVLDHVLPDVSGLEVARALRTFDTRPRFVVVSGFLTTTTTVEFMRLGAIHVFDKPFDADRLVDVLIESSPPSHLTKTSGWINPSAARYEKAAAQKWAAWVARGIESTADLRTLQLWARFVGVSVSRLCETCAMLDVAPHDARDFMRALRAVVGSRANHCRPDLLLDIGERRTLEEFVERAGSGFRTPLDGSAPFADFVTHQRFVPATNDAVQALLDILTSDSTG